MTNSMKLNNLRIQHYKSILSFFKDKKLEEVEFFNPILFDVDEGVTSNLITSVNIKTLNKNGELFAHYLNEPDDDVLINLTELNVIQIAHILDELEKGRYEILQTAE